MTQLPIMIRRRRYERPLPRPPPTRHHQPSRHLLSLIVALFSPCLSRYKGLTPGNKTLSTDTRIYRGAAAVARLRKDSLGIGQA